MANYFTKFPKITYKFADGKTFELVDTNIKYQLSENVKQKTEVFYKYGYKDSDRPDIIADKYYESDSYYWLVLASNNIFDVNYELPMTDSVFTKYLIEKYKESVGTKNLKNILDYTTTEIHHYEDKDGYEVDRYTFINQPECVAITIYDYEFNENEKLRDISLISNTRASDVRRELEDKLRILKAEAENNT